MQQAGGLLKADALWANGSEATKRTNGTDETGRGVPVYALGVLLGGLGLGWAWLQLGVQGEQVGAHRHLSCPPYFHRQQDA
eukprot:scaffold92395_cov18-Prasinocladus_malaysianus.AAC.1